jgi:hypothetical protein
VALTLAEFLDQASDEPAPERRLAGQHARERCGQAVGIHVLE